MVAGKYTLTSTVRNTVYRTVDAHNLERVVCTCSSNLVNAEPFVNTGRDNMKN